MKMLNKWNTCSGSGKGKTGSRIQVIMLIVIILLSGLPAQAQEMLLTLDQCVEIALEQNPNVRMSKYNQKISGKGVAAAFSGFLPAVSVSLDYSHSETGPSSLMRIDSQTGILVPARPNKINSWSSSASLNASYTVFDGGYTLSNYRQSRSLRDQAQYDFANTRQNTIYLVKERYYNLLRAEKLLEVAEKTVESSRESYKDASARYEIGDAPKTDLLRVSTQLKRDQLAVIRAQNDLSIARASLNHVLGFKVDRVIKVKDDLDLPELVEEYPAAMGSALEKHPLLLRGEAAFKSAQAGVGMALGRLSPSLSVWGRYSWENQDFNEISHILNRDYRWSTGISLSIPISQEFSRLVQVSQAKLQRSIARESYNLAKRDIELELTQAFFEVEQTKKQIAVAQEGVEFAEEDLRLNKEQYRLGSGSMLTLVTAQAGYTTAQSDYIQALYDFKFAEARLQRAMGVLVK